MALPTTNMRFLDRALALIAIGFDLDHGLKNEQYLPHTPGKDHVLAGVSLDDSWNGAVFTQCREPIVTQEPAFFTRAAAVIITIKVGTFSSGRCTHEVDYSMGTEEQA